MAQRTCIECGASVDHLRSDAITCSRRCRSKRGNRQWKARNPEAYRRQVERQVAANRVAKMCAWCGADFEACIDRVRFCSYSCGTKARYADQRDARLPVIHPNPDLPTVSNLPRSHPVRRWRGRTVLPTRSSSGGVWTQGCCPECGDDFCRVSFNPDHLASYCSPRCRSRAADHRRRTLKTGSFVANVPRKRIYERDGWRCQICHKAVNRKAVVPHPKAPTIDHIIPLAGGGTHEPSNVQLAHFMCNAIKGDRYGGDQLRLIG